MKPPKFWQNPPEAPGLMARLLAPLGWLTAAATARRVARASEYTAPVPVICIGGAHLGGTGKTPTTIAFAERLLARGVKVQVVSRGYGGSAKGPLRVDPARHSADLTGDEPLLIAAFVPVWVAKDRAAGVRAAVEAGAEAVLLDDGFQNPSVRKSASVLVVDAAEGFGNGRTAPAGPLREPPSRAMARADLILTLGDGAAQQIFAARYPRLPLPRVRAEVRPLETGMDWQGMRVFAFAGIGNPMKFFKTLEGLGAHVAGRVALADHQPIGMKLLQRLAFEANATGGEIVTTEKDAVRLPKAFQGRVLVLPVRLQPESWDEIDRLFDELGLKPRPAPRP